MLDIAPDVGGGIGCRSTNKGNELMEEWQKQNYSKPKIGGLQITIRNLGFTAKILKLLAFY